MPGPYTKLDANQVLKHSFDEENDRLRVEASVTAVIGDVSIVDSTTGDPLAVNADGSLDVNIVGPVDLVIQAPGDNIAISDGTNTLKINSDGSLNIAIEEPPVIVLNNYSEVTSVPASTPTTILSYTPSVDVKLEQVSVSGDNIAEYSFLVNGEIKDKARTYFGGNLNYLFNFGKGFMLATGDEVIIQVVHVRPSLGNFNARLQSSEG